MTDSRQTQTKERARRGASARRDRVAEARTQLALRQRLAQRAARDGQPGEQAAPEASPGALGLAAPVAREQLEAARRGPTVTLPGGVADALAATMGAKVHEVRVHADSAAASLARALDARAFAAGRDIFFAPEQLQPHRPEGAFLLAHEMAHAVRAPQTAPAGPAVIGPAGSAEERTADDLATSVMQRGAWSMLAGERRSAVQAGLTDSGPSQLRAERALPAMASSSQLALHLTPATATTQAPVKRRHDPAALEAAKLVGTPEWMKQNVLAVYRATIEEAGTPDIRYAAVERAMWAALGQQPETLSGSVRAWLTPLVSAELQTVLRSVRAAVNIVRAEGTASSTPQGEARPVAGADEELTNRFVRTLQECVHALANAGTQEKANEYGLAVWTGRLKLGGLSSFPNDNAGLPAYAGAMPTTIGQCLMGVARRTVSDVELVVTELPAALHIAAMNVVRAHTAWIEDDQLPAFIDELLEQPAGVAYLEEHPDAREALGLQADALRAVGEVMVLQKDIWGLTPSDEVPAAEQQYIAPKTSLPVDLKRWVQGGRAYQRSHYLIPTWRYYEEYIQGFSFMGGSAGKRNGLHSSLVARLPTVEATIRRRAAATGQDVGVFKFYGFRFALHGPGEHAMARAIDTRPKSNPQVRDPDTIALMGLLSGQEVSSRFQGAYGAINRRQADFEAEFATRVESVGPLVQAAKERVAALEAERETLKAQQLTAKGLVRAAGSRNDSPDITMAREDLERSTTGLEALEASMVDAQAALKVASDQLNAPIHAEGNSDSVQLARGYDQLQRLNDELRAGWNAVSAGAGGDVAAIAANITAKIAERVQALQTELAANEQKQAKLRKEKADLEAQIPNATQIRQRTEAHLTLLRQAGPLTQAQAATKRQQFAQSLRQAAVHTRQAVKALDEDLAKLKPRALKARVAELSDLSAKLQIPVQQQRLLSTGKELVSVQSVGQVAQQGMVDLPRWLVEGFVDCGWTWGGAAWGNMNNFDAMHFEYPINVPGGAV